MTNQTSIIPVDFMQYVIDSGTRDDGQRFMELSFPNGYGASIILGFGTYGLELAVLQNGQLTYDTPITSDVLGWLSPSDLPAILISIMALKE